MVSLQCTEKHSTKFFHRYAHHTLLAVSMVAITNCGGGGGSAGAPNIPNINNGVYLTITGTPETIAYYKDPSQGGVDYEFEPQTNTLPENLKFSIENEPSWASFNEKTGVLSGIPKQSDTGEYPNIRISVTDGKETAKLDPFSINVQRWDKRTFCAAQTKEDGLTHCSMITEDNANKDQCNLWAQFYSPSLDRNTLKLYSATTDGEINSLALAYCHKQEPRFDSNCSRACNCQSLSYA